MRQAFWLILSISVVILGCKKYTANPLPQASTDIKDTLLHLPQEVITLADLLKIASENNVELQLIKKQYEQQEKYARLKQPLANPVLEFGVSRGLKIENATQNLTQPFISLGFEIPLWGKRKLHQQMEFLEAAYTQQELVILHRKIYMDLLQACYQVTNTQSKLKISKTLLDGLEKHYQLQLLQMAQGLLESYAVEALRIDLMKEKLQTLQLEQELSLMYEKISDLSGIPLAALRKSAWSEIQLPTELPSVESLLEIWIQESPELNRLRAEYDLAEKRLQLEIRKQYPNLNLGGSFEKEPGETARYFGLSLGAEIPIFDRNQKAILLAEQSREHIFLRYQLMVNRNKTQLLNQLEKLKQMYQQKEFMDHQLLPAASQQYENTQQEYLVRGQGKENYEEARKGYFELLSTQREIFSRSAEALLEIESMIGRSLMIVPAIITEISKDVKNEK